MAKNKQRNRRIPQFKSREEEARFWDTHNFSDYMQKFTPVKGIFAKHLSQGSVVEQTAGILRNDHPALTPQAEHEAAAQGIAEEAIQRSGS